MKNVAKKRVLYAKKKLTKVKQVMLTSALDLLQYSCGGSIGCIEDDDENDNDSIYSVVFVRKNLNCRSPIEIAYYSANYSNICFHHCGANNVGETTDYYPICEDCAKNKKEKVKRQRNKNKKD